MRIIFIFLFAVLFAGFEVRGFSTSLPVILLDQGHNNWAWKPEIYNPVMERFLVDNGFQVRVNTGVYTRETLQDVQIVKIDNVFPAGDNENWSLPITSAFSNCEIDILKEWVEGGGSLMLVVEHMPFPGALDDLASAFGIELSNGFALDREKLGDLSEGAIAEAGYLIFNIEDGSLADHPVLKGRNQEENVNFVATDVGSAFHLPADGIPLLVLGEGIISLEPDVSWRFNDKTLSRVVAGWSQGGLLEVGKGRVAILGDSFLFTAPDFIEPPYLENEKDAEFGANNHQFTLNLLRWLSGEL